MNIRIKCVNPSLPDFGETHDCGTVRDYLLLDRNGFDSFRDDEDLPPLTDAQVDEVAEYVTERYHGGIGDDFSVDSQDGLEEGRDSFQEFYNFIVDAWEKWGCVEKKDMDADGEKILELVDAMLG